MFGISLSIRFDDKYANEYKLLCENKITSIPIEYYDINWRSFARENITSISIPIKSAMIDTISYTPISSSDIYINRIVRNILNENEIVNVTQAHRMMKEKFSQDPSIISINQKLAETSDRDLSISVDFGTRDYWENSLVTQLNNIPYNNIGKGTQCVLKTQLELSYKKIENKQIILIE